MSFDVFVGVFLVMALGERFFEHRFSQRAERGDRKMAWSFAALQIFYVAVFVATAVEYYGWPRPIHLWVTGLGLGLTVVALVVRLTAIRTLGKFWSLDLEIRPQHQLMTEGIYRHVRHPAYSSIMLEMVAVPLVANAYGTLLLAVGIYVPLLLWRWRVEEMEMIKKFGDRYVQYRREVPAFVPGLGGRGKLRD
ncbi:MAG: isoprenylcysteine carboxylmethyltransferase family protein [Verrucomicrobiota bacterium]